MSWDDLNAVLTHHRLEAPRFRLAANGEQVPPYMYSRPIVTRRSTVWHQLQPSELHQRLAEGATLVLDAVDELHPSIGALAGQLERWLRTGATWRGFSSGLFDVPALLELATKAGGPQHHLRAIQLPVSLVHLAPVAQALDGHGPLVDALDAGLEVFASAPLHGGEIPGILTRELTDLISPGSTPAQAALAVIASTTGVERVLLSTGIAEHWTQAADTVGRSPLSPDVLRRVVDVLGT